MFSFLESNRYSPRALTAPLDSIKMAVINHSNTNFGFGDTGENPCSITLSPFFIHDTCFIPPCPLLFLVLILENASFFSETVNESQSSPLRCRGIETSQVNLGYLFNKMCSH
jgi:hypothetical protein